jgi:hypothetical protein
VQQRRALRLAAAAACAAFAALSVAAGASAGETQTLRGLHDARYCEVLELKGFPPDAQVVVWNTVGLNECPAEQWTALDAGALAAEHGDTIVLLNGPRYFLMDSVTATPSASQQTFGGLAMRLVATIAIHSAADLAQTPYAERTIDRDNKWRWKKGRRVFELLAPDGSAYVMQSYSQIRDPALTIGSLPSLGERLGLPEGWSYRARKLKRKLTLSANGSATIIQDDLLNTYQRR